MTHVTLTIAIGFACIPRAATPLPVTVVSPCECRDDHGKGRWSLKNDPSTPPLDVRAIHAIMPSDGFGWSGVDVPLGWESIFKKTCRSGGVRVEPVGLEILSGARLSRR
jgi:hypothetical protein